MNILIDIRSVCRSKILLLIDYKQCGIDESGAVVHRRVVDVQQKIDFILYRDFHRILLNWGIPSDIAMAAYWCEHYRFLLQFGIRFSDSYRSFCTALNSIWGHI